MPTYCCHPRCSNNSNQGYTFKTIPLEAQERSNFIKAANYSGWNPPNNARLCENHFDTSAIFRLGSKKYIATNALPTAFCKCPERPEKRRARGQLQSCAPEKKFALDHNYSYTPIIVSIEKENETCPKPKKCYNFPHIAECVTRKPPTSLKDLPGQPQPTSTVPQTPPPISPVSVSKESSISAPTVQPTSLSLQTATPPFTPKISTTLSRQLKQLHEGDRQVKSLQKEVSRLKGEVDRSTLIKERALNKDEQKGLL